MSRWKRFAVCSDIHGDQHDARAVDAFFAFVDDYRPQIRVIAGDLWDFRAIRRKADEHERRESMKEDYQAGLNFLNRFKPQVITLGNHDARMWNLAETATGPLQDHALDVVAQMERAFKKIGCKALPYNKRENVYKLGNLSVLHGFFCGVYACRQHAIHYGLCVFGHTHQLTEHAVARYPHGETAWNCGCLCRLNMDFNAARPGSLAQRHGWAYGVVDERSGDFVIHLAKEVSNKYVASTEINWY